MIAELDGWLVVHEFSWFTAALPRALQSNTMFQEVLLLCLLAAEAMNESQELAELTAETEFCRPRVAGLKPVMRVAFCELARLCARCGLCRLWLGDWFPFSARWDLPAPRLGQDPRASSEGKVYAWEYDAPSPFLFGPQRKTGGCLKGVAVFRSPALDMLSAQASI